MGKTFVKADLHIHLEGHNSKEDVIQYLINAEQNGVKKLTLLDHNRLDILKPLKQILSEKGGIKKYYSGEFIVGVEFNALIDAHHVNPDGTNYDGNMSHILGYMTLSDAINLNNNCTIIKRDIEQDYIDDFATLCDKIRGLEGGERILLPKIEELKTMNTPHIVKDLHKWIISDAVRKEEYTKLLQLTEAQLLSPSVFIRQIAMETTGILYYKPQSIPMVTELFREVPKYAPSIRFVLAHPAYMSTYFDTQYYLDTMFSIPQISNKPNFYGIEVGYFLNTPEETEYLKKFAIQNDLKMSAGSDGRHPTIKMFFKPKNSADTFIFYPSIGTAIASAYYNNQVEHKIIDGQDFICAINDAGQLKVEQNFLSDIAVQETDFKSDKNLCDSFDFQ